MTSYCSCDCYGHATSCNLANTPYTCSCTKESFTFGRQCDLCDEGSYYNPNNNDHYAGDFCVNCGCNITGTIGSSTVCHRVSPCSHLVVLCLAFADFQLQYPFYISSRPICTGFCKPLMFCKILMLVSP